MPRERLGPRSTAAAPTQPFSSAEEAWFWFMQAHQALLDGAKPRAGAALTPRPCEPVDIFRALDRLYRHRRLIRDHVAVLAHYGRRLMAPDPVRRREARSAGLWREALERLEGPLRRKGIVA